MIKLICPTRPRAFVHVMHTIRQQLECSDGRRLVTRFSPRQKVHDPVSTSASTATSRASATKNADAPSAYERLNRQCETFSPPQPRLGGQRAHLSTHPTLTRGQLQQPCALKTRRLVGRIEKRGNPRQHQPNVAPHQKSRERSTLTPKLRRAPLTRRSQDHAGVHQRREGRGNAERRLRRPSH